jgi:hypothetical protein
VVVNVMRGSRIGILELKDDPFIIDVVSKLADLPVEFLSLAEQPAPITGDYGVIVDRLSFRFPFLKEVVKSMSLCGTYVINNPFAASASDKLVDALVFQLLGIPSPKSIVLPGPELKEEIGSLVAEPSWSRIADEVGLPCVFKPVDGYGWDDVYMPNTLEELKELYASHASGKVWLVQRKINYKHYYRVFCINQKDVLFVRWIPKPLGMGEYLYTDLEELTDIKSKLAEHTVHMNSCLDMDINVVEWCIDEQGQPWVIDAFNEVPDMPKSRMPPDYYWWIVDRFVACIRDKMTSDKQNKHSFTLPSPS